MKGVTSAFLAILVFISLMILGEAMTCSEIQNNLMPCAGYLTGGSNPSEACCNSVRSLATKLQTQQDRQTACNCIKNAASSYGVQPDTASNLLGKCNISVKFPVGPNTDCSQVA